MNRYLIIVPITGTYMAEGEALLRSLTVHNPDIPVDVISVNGQADYLKAKFPNVRQVVNEPPCDSEFRQVRTSRFRHAADVKAEFDVCCLLDADMISVRPMKNIFKMAAAGTILACSNNTLFRYLHKDFELMKVTAPLDINVVHGSFSTVPMFINPTIQEPFLRAIWENETGNDLDTLNLLIHSLGLYDNSLYLLNSYCWTNIHHSMLKPETYLKATDDGYYSHQGEPVYMMHGHLHDPRYHAQLIEPMIKNYGYHKPYIDCARNCIGAMVKEYSKYYVPPQEAL
jgi:hypothetical protein